MKMIISSAPMYQNYEPYIHMCEQFILRLYHTAGLKADVLENSPIGSVILPSSLNINYDEQPDFSLVKQKDIYLAQKERKLISEVLSIADVSWDTLLKCCSYNDEKDLLPLKKYYTANPLLRNVMQVMNQYIDPQNLAKYLQLVPFHAFQFRFLNFPDSIQRKCQLYLRGYSTKFYSIINDLKNNPAFHEDDKQRLTLNRSIPDSLDRVLSDWTVFLKHSSLNTIWFGDNPTEKEQEDLRIGGNLAYIVIALALSRWTIERTMDEVNELLKMDFEKMSLATIFQYIELYEGAETVGIYTDRSGWEII